MSDGITYGMAQAFGNRVDSMRENRDLWQEDSIKKGNQIEQLKREYQRLSDKHVRMSGKLDTLSTMLGWLATKPSVKAIGAIHQMKAKALKYKAEEEFWNMARKREANIVLMAEAEYDYHVLGDPIYRLHSAGESLLKIADNTEDPRQAEKIKALVAGMQSTAGARDDAHRIEVINARVKEIEEHIKYENAFTLVPIYDSIPRATILENVAETEGDNWKLIENRSNFDARLITDIS